MSSSKPDSQEFRRALGRFATGVAVVTTQDQLGRHAGITVSSFSSVSLDPPLVLWSIGRQSASYDTFAVADHFVVNVLTRDQQDICARFARTRFRRFDDLDCRQGIGGAPILPTYAAMFECTTEHRYAGGDHQIIVGRVANFDIGDAEPLIICRGEFLQTT